MLAQVSGSVDSGRGVRNDDVLQRFAEHGGYCALETVFDLDDVGHDRAGARALLAAVRHERAHAVAVSGKTAMQLLERFEARAQQRALVAPALRFDLSKSAARLRGVELVGGAALAAFDD